MGSGVSLGSSPSLATSSLWGSVQVVAPLWGSLSPPAEWEWQQLPHKGAVRIQSIYWKTKSSSTFWVSLWSPRLWWGPEKWRGQQPFTQLAKANEESEGPSAAYSRDQPHLASDNPRFRSHTCHKLRGLSYHWPSPPAQTGVRIHTNVLVVCFVTLNRVDIRASLFLFLIYPITRLNILLLLSLKLCSFWKYKTIPFPFKVLARYFMIFLMGPV